MKGKKEREEGAENTSNKFHGLLARKGGNGEALQLEGRTVGVRNAAHAGLAGHSLPVQSAASLAAMQVTIIAMSSRRVERSKS